MEQADLTRVRAEIDREVTGRTLLDLLDHNAELDGDRPALSRKGDHGWETIAWAEYRARVQAVAAGLAALGVEPGDAVAIMAANRPEHVIADLAALTAAAVPVTFYSSLSPDQIRYIATDCGAKVAVVEDTETATRWLSVRDALPRLDHLVILESESELLGRPGILGWEELLDRGTVALRADHPRGFSRRALLRPEDPATFIYTSGTTGPPKGVRITQHGVLWMLASVGRIHAFPRYATAVSYLPLAHIAERMFTHYQGLNLAGSVYFCPDVRQAVDYVREARPKAFLAVPRVWEKMQAALLGRIEAETGAKGALARRALATGRRVASLRLRGEAIPARLRGEHALLDSLVLSKIRSQLGLDQCEFAVTAAAPISVEVLEFFAGLGILIHEAYGMTETTALISANRPGRVRLGTVGEPIPGVEVRIAEDHEILARGPNLAGGYLNRPEATAETWGEDGWLHTGDLGWLTEEGYLEITGRKKELIITSGGKNVSPAEIEHRLKQHPLIGQACAVGDGKPYITALLVLDPDVAPVWARNEGIATDDLAELAAHPKVLAAVQAGVDAANAGLSRVEQVKRFVVLPVEWTAESPELTPTLKLRRHVIRDRYEAEIAALYPAQPEAAEG